MSITNPYFTIVIPTYNRASLIKKTLESVLNQTFTDYEVIVVDDGGKDNTEEVVKSLNCDKIIYCRKENGERGAARNFGWKLATGTYITFLDSDDVLYPDHLEEAHRFLMQRSKIYCYAQAYEIKRADSGKVLVKAYQTRSATINGEIVKGNFLSCFGIFLRREVGKEVMFEEDRRFAGTEDWLLWLQLAARHPFYYNNAVTGALQEHDSRSVLSFDEQSLLYRTNYLKSKLEHDSLFLKKYNAIVLKKIYAHMLTYTSLHLAMSRKKARAISWFTKAVAVDPGALLTRRSLAIAKKIILGS